MKILKLLKRPVSYGLITFTLLLAVSCEQDVDRLGGEDDLAQLVIPDDFNHATTREVSVSLLLLDNQDNPLSHVKLQLFDANPVSGGRQILVGATNDQGIFSAELSIPAYLDTLVLATSYIGLINHVLLPVKADRLQYTIGGSQPQELFSLDGQNAALAEIEGAVRGENARTSATFKTLGSWNSQGIPAYLESNRDVISAGLLERINASLPEGKPVPQFHPDYLADDVKTNVEITQTADVWVTFVHEGAGWTNSLGFYTYPTNNPPVSRDDISEITFIFPNVSFQGSGGGLRSGDKVRIGRFEAGTSIGFVLMAQGWTSSNASAGGGRYMHFTHPGLNNEDDPSIRLHNVLLYDNEDDIVLLGFEDVRRDNTPINCDNDFNDAVFYVSSNPVTAIESSSYLPIDTPVDSDNDGISDIYDDYPNDPLLAFDNYFPSVQSWGVLAFEDLWPGKGDFDLNDLIVAYRYHYITNVSGQIWQLNAQFTVRAIGASYQNGFGFSLDIPPSEVASVSGLRHSADYITLNQKNLEAGQVKSVIIPFDNAYNLVDRPGGYFVNTQTEGPFVVADTVNVNIRFNRAIQTSALGTAPYNPFIIVDQERGREIHLPDHPPTEKADPKYFGSSHDSSRPSSNRYYKTNNNLPWAIHFSEEFDYPEESHPIDDAYLYFDVWAESGGQLRKDWYLNQEKNVNSKGIYRRR